MSANDHVTTQVLGTREQQLHFIVRVPTFCTFVNMA